MSILQMVFTRKGWCPRTGKGQRFMVKVVVTGYVSSDLVWECLMSQLFWQHAKIIFQNKNHLNMIKENPAKRLKFGRNCLIVALFGPQAPGVQLTWILFLGKYTQSSWCLWLFENEFTKSVRKAPILRQY